jgi:exopolysaccharide biosynthesis polyprenyl glycosylphosphotransferase
LVGAVADDTPWTLAGEAETSRFGADALRRRLLALADLGSVLVTAGALVLVGDRVGALLVLAFAPGWIVIAKLCGLYDRDHRTIRHLTVDELPYILLWALGGTAALTIVALPFDRNAFDGVDLLIMWSLLTLSALALRGSARYAWRRWTAPERVLLVGSGAAAAAARRKLDLFPDTHAVLVSRRDECTVEDLAASEEWLDGIDRIIVAPPSVDAELLRGLLAACREHQVKLSLVPPNGGLLTGSVQLAHVADLQLVEFHTWDTSRSTLLIKRAIDLVAGSALLVLLSPLMLVVALAVLLTSGRPIFFRQTRAGLDGRPFRLVKFRTMVADAEARLPDVVSLDELDEPMFKLEHDPRVTPLGRFLRRTSLDELPQLFNVVRGDMSLVGTRPEQLDLVARYRPEHLFRLRVKPGLTGPMQIYGRGRLTFEERLAVERDYVENLSLRRDLRILFMTVAPVFNGRGAY